MMDIMPSRRLIRHEWEKHGVCAGLTPAEYFAKARAAFSAVRIPPAMQGPRTARTVPPARIRDEFIAANPALPAAAISVTCSGRFLNEVRVCLGKDLKGRACSADVARQACRLPEIIVQPVR
jgi:ribonuclease T2